MAVVLRRFTFCKPIIRISDLNKQNRVEVLRYSVESKNNETRERPEIPHEIDGFQVLHLYPKTDGSRRRTERVRKVPNPPRTTRMTPDQDWPSVWPTARTFHPASVPLPLFQGCNKHGPPPGKYANTELMKIPNFLHLTPPAIERHCNALKKFCTEWPKELKDDETIEKHFPLEIVYSDYCHSSSSIRDKRARIVSLKVKLKNLEFDKHSKDKFLRLVGARYDPETDYVTITTDSCPLKKQNYDYAHYLLTAVYFESWRKEEWEKEKSDDDMEEYYFSSRQCFRNIKSYFDYNSRELPDLKEHGSIVENWLNGGDNPEIIKEFKESVMKLLSLPPLETEG